MLQFTTCAMWNSFNGLPTALSDKIYFIILIRIHLIYLIRSDKILTV